MPTLISAAAPGPAGLGPWCDASVSDVQGAHSLPSPPRRARVARRRPLSTSQALDCTLRVSNKDDHLCKSHKETTAQLEEGGPFFRQCSKCRALMRPRFGTKTCATCVFKYGRDKRACAATARAPRRGPPRRPKAAAPEEGAAGEATVAFPPPSFGAGSIYQLHDNAVTHHPEMYERMIEHTLSLKSWSAASMLQRYRRARPAEADALLSRLVGGRGAAEFLSTLPETRKKLKGGAPWDEETESWIERALLE